MEYVLVDVKMDILDINVINVRDNVLLLILV